MRCAVPAFMRVEPAIGSGPVASRIGWSASTSSGVSALLAMPTVKAPRSPCFAQAGQRERRGAARRHRDQHIGGVDARGARDELGGVPDLVLGALDGLRHAPRRRRPAAAAGARAAS